jgi:arginine deiminase
MVYEPLILKTNKYATLHMIVRNGKIESIEEVPNIPFVLNKLGMPVKPVLCGGTHTHNQEREQWHSGANFFAFAPGRVIGYERNTHTVEELSKEGFSVLKASDVISGKENVDDHEKLVVTIHGSELARGGGGARCMTMPVRREVF